ncbi:MAG: hypothetical protein ACREMB_01150, partial [Candidatus Rokuibacteriota bacterium]
MTGRSVHDALLRVLTSAALRARLRDGTAGGLPSGLGAAEVAVLRTADPERLRRLARFMGRHFYRERIVRLFAGGRALARRRGQDPLDVLAGDAFGALLESAEVGSAETADRVASLVEARLRAALAGLGYAGDLVAYEGMLFRAEAGPRRWSGDGAAEGIPVRAAHTRVCALDWDVTGLVAAVRRGDAALPEPTRQPARLLLALSPNGRVTAARCPEPVERLLAALDGRRSA